ncbi:MULTISPECIES: hypothetical protein [unclassified Nostoc]|uniref:hypothetical protein n=1 Tax=unclassified Nostoc TaxID=2593658 RepID=UPI002AD49E8D|nr:MULTISPECIES: hypothetical protein [unclassified Nostoc]MDZ8121199.1 hypothetical protein [Nostoc sp. CmiVER01]MDZ8224179.1 hypothetical protein [Nostoc sp. ChiVER01]
MLGFTLFNRTKSKILGVGFRSSTQPNPTDIFRLEGGESIDCGICPFNDFGDVFELNNTYYYVKIFF